MKKVLYFAYGANKDLAMIKAITGVKNPVGKKAILNDFRLYSQKLDQITNSVLKNAPKKLSPRQILSKIWDGSFESYAIKPGKGKVSGTLWTLTEEEREHVRNWELIYFGWYKEIKVEVIDEKGNTIKAITEKLRGNQRVDREINGIKYKPYLVNRNKILKIARKARVGKIG